MRPLRIPALALAAALPVVAGPPQDGWFWEGRLHLTLAPGGPDTLGADVHGHLGLGTGLALGHDFGGGHRLRLVGDFAGTRLATAPGGSYDGGDLADVQRTLRLGLEHQMALTRNGAWQVFYGGGVQNSWVARVDGTLGWVALIAVTNAILHAENTAQSSNQGSVLDLWSPYGTVGLGLEGDPDRVAQHLFAEARLVASPYRRWRGTGLTATPGKATEDRLGLQVVLTVGYRGW